jgi:prepilin-type N-terminal cleavage/methylation domain-containing protein
MSMKKNTKSAFTLIETMVAVSILALAVTGPLLTASRAMVVAELSQEQLTASYLAQEGIEYVRAVRDNAYLFGYPGGTSTAAWTTFLQKVSQCSAPNNSCQYDSGAPALTQCSNNVCALLYLTPSPSYYTVQPSSGNTQTPFRRAIQVSAAGSSGTEEVVTSTVSWSFHGTSYTVAVTDHLTPWQ